jgi:hypothetical protein
VRGSSSDEEEENTRQQEGLSSSASVSSNDSSNANADDDATNANDVSTLEDDDHFVEGEGQSKIVGDLLCDEDEGAERIVCDLAIPVQADLILFNGAKKAMTIRGSANFGSLVGRGGGTSTNTPATATSACGETFRVEVGTTPKTVIYTPTVSPVVSQQRQQRVKPQRRSVNVNFVHIYCRSSPKDEYVRLTDIPLFQVTARASPTNSKQVDLLFPVIPPLTPLPTDGSKDKGPAKNTSTHRFLSNYCIVDHASSSEGTIPRLELEAPNRMTRESFLLSLGIANFRGKAVQLDNKKVLYRDDGPILKQVKQQQLPSAATDCSSKTSPKSNSSNTNAPSFQPSPPPPESSQSQLVEPKATVNEEDDNLDSPTPDKEDGGQVLPGRLSLSPSRPSDVIGESKNVLSPITCQSNPESTPQSAESDGSISSIPEVPAMPSAEEVNSVRVKVLEREMEILRAQLARKDTIVTELQRQVQSSDAAHQKTRQALSNTRQELKQSQENCEHIQMSKRHVERSMQSQHEATQKLELDHKAALNGLEAQLSKQAEKIAELEKLKRALQNEKAVLGATVEARESKLVKLEELQISNTELSKKIAQQGVLEAQLEESHRKRERLRTEFETQKEAEIECREELEAANATIQIIRKRIQGEQEKASSCQRELEAIQKKNQQLKGERNNYKQKNESLSKEVARLCRGGKNIRDIEKVLADHEALQQETELLRAQKRKALEDAHKYRISYEQAKAADEVLSLKPDERETRRILERTAELERLLSEMTDYVSAKQMQLDTLKEVNEELQTEIHSLAQANLRPDEV